MTAEAWPTEDAATKAVDAAARKAYDGIVKQRTDARPSTPLPAWEHLHPTTALEIREQVLPLVWAALEALPDPRHAAWAEGYNSGIMDEFHDEPEASENPYPSGL